MNPTASPFTFPVRNVDMDMSVVQYEQNANRCSHSEKETSLKDAVFHQVVKDLIQDTQLLASRCSGLEAENVALKTEMVALKQLFSTAVSTAPTTKANMTGYASSDESLSGETEVLPQTSVNAIESLLKRADHHEDTVNEILIQFREMLELEVEERRECQRLLLEEIEERKTLGKHIEQDRRNLVGIKGRIGAYEKKVKDLQEEVNQKEPDQTNNGLYSHFVRPATANNGMRAYAQSDLTKVHEDLSMVLDNVRELQQDVEEQGAAMKQLQLIIATGNKGTANSQVVRSNGSPSMVDVEIQLSAMKYSIDSLKIDVDGLSKMAGYERTIDNAKNKDELYTMYHQLGNDLWEEEKISPFKGLFDELWALRERLLRRLALFEQCSVAMEEAKAAHVDL